MAKGYWRGSSFRIRSPTVKVAILAVSTAVTASFLYMLGLTFSDKVEYGFLTDLLLNFVIVGNVASALVIATFAPGLDAIKLAQFAIRSRTLVFAAFTAIFPGLMLGILARTILIRILASLLYVDDG